VTNRILDFAESAAFVHLSDELLVVRRQGEETARIPVADIAVIIASHREVTMTQAAIAALASAGGILVCCDEKHRPAGMLMPLAGHTTQAERFRKQAEASEPVRKRIWQELVRAKIQAQAAALESARGEDGGLRALAARVRSGDAGNSESIAAQRYWPRLFDRSFRRGNEEDTRNHLLDYGYAILRAACCRAICASGLHPSLGVHHTNRYNCFALADDFMEPCRPLIDRGVAGLCGDADAGSVTLDRTAKAALIGAVLGRYRTGEESRTLFDILTRSAQELANRLTGESTGFRFPDIDAE
jgi:CRISPR-associated protein Cas1